MARKRIEEILQPFILADETYEKVVQLLDSEMNAGLGKVTNPSASVKMFPSYVRALPDGSESGNYLALDLGGTNFRVLLIKLSGKHVEMDNEIYPIPDDIMTGDSKQLFDHIVDCIAKFTKARSLDIENLPLGFTFSFPCKQEGLAVGRLVMWTKGFDVKGVVGEDVVQLLHDAIERRPDVKVECVAILNDTVGCLMSCAFHDHDTEVGVILGTGTNACYMEKLEKVDLWDGATTGPQQVIINTEWGAFGDDGGLSFIQTEIDKEVDRLSVHPSHHIFEKMISGLYLGELVRQNLVKCAEEGLLFGGNISGKLATYGEFQTKFVSEVEKDQAGSGFTATRQILSELGYESVSNEDCEAVKLICAVVSRRAAYLASSGIATILNRINKPNVTVGVDGSLYRYHPEFHKLMMQKIPQLIRPGIKFKLMLSEDGSGKGAAVVAAVSSRVRRLRSLSGS